MAINPFNKHLAGKIDTAKYSISSQGNRMSVDTEQFIRNLLARMSIDDKIGQLNQYFSFGKFDPQVIRQGKAGSIIIAEGALTGASANGTPHAETCNQIQQIALEAPHKIPQIFGRDV